MATLLRPSARQLGRLASTSLRSASTSGRRLAEGRALTGTIRITACGIPRSRRCYATDSDPSPREKKIKSDKDTATTPAKRSDGRSVAPDFESDAPRDDKATSVDETSDPVPGPLPGRVLLQPHQMAVLETMLKNGAVPEKSRELTRKLIEKFKIEGVPPGFQDVLEKAHTKQLGIGDAMKIMKMAWHLATVTVKEKDVFNSYAYPRSEDTDKPADTPHAEAKTSKEPGPSKEQSQAGPGQTKSQSTAGDDGGGASSKKESNKKDPRNPLDPKDLFNTVVSSAIFFALYSYIFPGETSREITWQELRKNYLEKGLVEKFVVYDGQVRVDLNREAVKSMYPDNLAANPGFNFYFSIGSKDAFEMRLEEAQKEMGIPSAERIPVSYGRSGMLSSVIMNFGPTLLFVGLLMYMGRRAGGSMGGGGGGVFGMGKSKAKMFNQDSAVKVKFSDVAGMDEAKLEIMEFVSFLKQPDKFIKLGAKIPRGAILSGPPGTGKTLLAKATAGESGVPFFSVSGSEFVEMFVGVGASRVRDLFSNARKNAPCIIFIDEIDAVGRARGESSSRFGGNDEREATLNQILTEMDGFNTTEQVVVLAGTNRPDVLDKALMRPGRFDRQIHIDRPTISGRVDIFNVYLKKVKTDEDLEYISGRLAALTPGFAGADIANVVNEAALVAARANATSVEMVHFEQAIERVVGGLERKSLVLNPEERKTVAYHEAGHAICGWFFEYADPLLKVSIIPRGKGALGYAQYLPTGDAYLMNTHQLMDRMAMTLGGRISEELHFSTVTTGASDDFKKVTNMATTMVTQWGMSEKLGPIHFDSSQDNSFTKPFAELTAQTIDSEVKRIVGEAYKQCKDLLTEKKKEVGIVAEELLRKEMLTRDDMVRLLGQRPFKEKEEFTKYFNDDGGMGARSPPPMENPPAGGVDGMPDGPTPSPAFKGEDVRL